MNKPEFLIIAWLLLPLTLWTEENTSPDPFAEPPAPPVKIMQVPVNDSKERVVVTACLITLEEDDFEVLLQQFPELKQSDSNLQTFRFPESEEPVPSKKFPLSWSQVLHIDAQSFLEKVRAIKSAEIIYTPQLHGCLGKTVTFSEGSSLIFPTSWEADPENHENLVPLDFETRHIGLKFSFTAEHQKDVVHSLVYSFSHTELVGLLHVQTGKAYQGDLRDRDALRSYYPVFQGISHQNSSIRISLGETVILGGQTIEIITKGEDGDAKIEAPRTIVLQTLSLERYEEPGTKLQR